MKILRRKSFLIIIIFLIIIFLFGFWFFYSAPRELEVIFLDVGQGDAFLIKTPFGQNILIDGGPDRSVLESLSKYLPLWDREIDLMILTHPHDDHIAGLIEVEKFFDVDRALYTAVNYDSDNYNAWKEKLLEKNIPATIMDKPQKINKYNINLCSTN
jgi:competence protein ComEC